MTIYARRRIMINAIQYDGSNHIKILDMLENVNQDKQAYPELINGQIPVLADGSIPKLDNYYSYEESGIGIDPADGLFKLDYSDTTIVIEEGLWIIKNEPGSPRMIELLSDDIFNARYFKWK